MSFDTVERSNYDGEPIALYEFAIGTSVWRYTSDEDDTIVGAVTYKATSISDSGVVQSGEVQNNDVTITLPATEEIATLFNATPPSEETWVTIRRKQRGEPDAPVIWIGTVSGSKQTGLRTMQFTCQFLTASFNRAGLRLAWSRQCPHALYDQNCRANKAAFAVAMQVESVDGVNVVAAPLANYPNGWFANGFFEFQMIPGTVERRPIEFHHLNAFSVLGTTDGLQVGMFIVAYPGCSRTTVDCNNKFNNLSNYGGFPHLPGKSPFDGDPIF